MSESTQKLPSNLGVRHFRTKPGRQQMLGWTTCLVWWWRTPRFSSLTWSACCDISGDPWTNYDQLNHQPGGVLALAALDRSRSIMWPTNTFAHEQTFFTMAVRQDRRGSAIQRTSEREAGVYATAERHLDVLGRCLHLRSLEIRR